jgi:O-methyltransferase
MIGMERLNNLETCLRDILARDVPGDVLEAGVWRGGACIFMRGLLQAFGVDDRRVWVADSFAGLPPPDPIRYPADKDDHHSLYRELAVSRAQVEDNFRRYGLLDDSVWFLEGWFEDTLAAAPIDRLALLRLDGDMYGSTIVTLEALYPKVCSGGYVIIDDYGAIPACRRAVDDYRADHDIVDELRQVDWTGVFWQKCAVGPEVTRP